MKIGTFRILLLAGLLAGVVAALVFLRSGDALARSRAADHRETALRVLGEHLAREFAGRKALIVSNPYVEGGRGDADVRRFELAGIDGLKRGWGDRIQLLRVVYPALRPEAVANPESIPVDPESQTPLSFLQTEPAWDDLQRAHPDADVWVSLIGVPVNLRRLEVWQRPKPALALLLPDVRMLGGHDGVMDAFQSGKLAAMVVARPGSPPEAAQPEPDYRAEFERRFLLVTAENVARVLELYPALF